MQAAIAPAKDSLDELYENGFCSMYGIGGKTSFFGPDIPKPNKISAPKLSDADKSMLLSICGASWDKAEHACCDAVQLSQLKTNLAKADALISSCPACKENFYQLFCHFTCSPNQSQFVDVTSTTTATNGEPIVEELDFYIDKSFASSFYDSCKNIKFGVTNGYAMDLIGGGATNYTQFLKFLGDKKPQIGGSPFQINYKYDLSGHDNLTLFDTTARSCNDSDINFACACSDCPQVCPVLDELPISSCCEVYGLSCTTFTILSSYFIVLISFFSILKFIRYKKNRSTMTRSLINDDDLLDSNSNLNSSFASQDTIHLLNIQSRQSYVINNKLESVFYKLGFFCSSYPKFVIAISLAVALILSSFVSFLEFEKNPVNLWVSPHSDAFIQKGIFDENFGPFYRTQQIIISNSTGDSVLQDFDFIQWWFETESKILDLRTDVMIDHSNYSVGYQDICFKPLEDTCVVESFTQYFDGDIGQLTEANYKQKLKSCANSPVECLPSFQQPIKKNVVFGGNEDDDILTSQAVVITLLNNNNNDPFTEQILKASGWEHELENYILNNVTAEAKKRNLDISFMTEISLEKELGKSTNTDIRIVVISYLIMFAYASMALSINPNNLSMADASFVTPWGRVAGTNAILKYLSKTKISLGLIGILIVLLSVLSSMGFWSLFHLKSTLIIAEVIPFLILAVGVDNIFLISSEFCNVEKLSITSSLNLEQKVAKTMANIGPSILLSSSCQFLCFILGTFVGMPAVKNFSLYTSVAVVFNTLLQITTFVSIFSLDQRRILSGRLDLLPFIKIEHNLISLPETSQGEEPLDSSNSLCQLLSSNDGTNESNFIKEFFRDKFGPFCSSRE